MFFAHKRELDRLTTQLGTLTEHLDTKHCSLIVPSTATINEPIKLVFNRACFNDLRSLAMLLNKMQIQCEPILERSVSKYRTVEPKAVLNVNPDLKSLRNLNDFLKSDTSNLQPNILRKPF